MALYDTLRRLEEGERTEMAATTMLARYGDLLRTGANEQDKDYEALLDAMRRLILNDTQTTTIADAQSFHSRLIELKESTRFGALAGKVVVSTSDEIGVDQARNSFSAFLSLYTLSPVLLSASDGALELQLKAAWPELYQKWQDDKNMTDYERWRKANFNDVWIASRSEMLAALNMRNQLDLGRNQPITSGALDASGRKFEDKAKDEVVHANIGAHRVLDYRFGLTSFGGNAGALLQGYSYEDYLFGGDGSDTLMGSGGSDYLEGGVGNDSYVMKANSGLDYIYDKDGVGSISFNGTTANGGTFARRGSWGGSLQLFWEDRANGLQYFASGGGVLRIERTDGSGRVIVLGWQEGELGITLKPAAPSPAVPGEVNGGHRRATQPPNPRDPLAIDLDGDGIEVLGAGAPVVLFDHDGDGVKTGTGWLKPDDAWLVLDSNGNGRIDTGAELFGVDTRLPNGQLARNGFEALSALDANGDQLFDANDAAFTQVRLWRDLNGDGVSQANELSSLQQNGIVSIGLVPTATNIDLGNGNTITGKSVVNRVSGTTDLSSVVVGSDAAGNLDLANNPFYREFAPIPLADVAMGLPDLRGSGLVGPRCLGHGVRPCLLPPPPPASHPLDPQALGL